MVLPATAEHTGGLCMPHFKKPRQEAAAQRRAELRNDPDVLNDCASYADAFAHAKHRQDAIDDFQRNWEPLLELFREEMRRG